MKFNLVSLISLLNISCILSDYHSATSNRKDERNKVIKTHKLDGKCLYCPPLPSCASVLCASGTTCVETPSICSECGKVECKKGDYLPQKCLYCPPLPSCSLVDCASGTICVETPSTCSECGKVECKKVDKCAKNACPRTKCPKCPKGYKCAKVKGECCTNEKVCVPDCKKCEEDSISTCKCKEGPGWTCEIDVKDRSCWECPKQSCTSKPECKPCSDGVLPKAGSLKCPTGWYAGYPTDLKCKEGYCPTEECVKYEIHEMCAECMDVECSLQCIEGYECGYADSCANCMSREVCRPKNPEKKCIDCHVNKLPPAGSLKCPEGSYAGYPKQHSCPEGKCPAEECIKYSDHEICALCLPTKCALECVEGYECGYADSCANCLSTEVCRPKNPEKKCIDCDYNELPPAGSLSCPEGSYPGYPKESECPKGKCPAEECIKFVKKEGCEKCMGKCSLNCIENFHCEYSDNCGNCVSNHFCKPNILDHEWE